MAQTENFGFEKFASSGSISQNGYKFSWGDRDTLDRLLWQLFNHDHRQSDSTQLNEPLRPTLTKGAGGTINAGASLYYRLSFIDSNGNETAGSQEQSVLFDPPLSPPAAPSLVVADTGGVLEAGTYRYALSYYQTAGGQTFATNVNQTIASTATTQITIGLPSLPANAAGWKIYRKGPPDANYYLLDTVAGGATPPTEYVDDGGTLANCLVYRPTQNTTNGGNSVTVSINSTDLPLDTRVAGWKIYRTTQSGTYPSSSLVATVTATLSETDTTLVSSYTDTGTGALAGTPQSVTVAPPGVPQLDAGDVFSALSQRLPESLAPQGVRTWSGFAQALSSNFWESDLYVHTTDAIVVDPQKHHTVDALIGGPFREHTSDAIALATETPTHGTHALLGDGFKEHTTDVKTINIRNGLRSGEYGRTVAQTDMLIERFEFFFLDPPRGMTPEYQVSTWYPPVSAVVVVALPQVDVSTTSNPNLFPDAVVASVSLPHAWAEGGHPDASRWPESAVVGVSLPQVTIDAEQN